VLCHKQATPSATEMWVKVVTENSGTLRPSERYSLARSHNKGLCHRFGCYPVQFLLRTRVTTECDSVRLTNLDLSRFVMTGTKENYRGMSAPMCKGYQSVAKAEAALAVGEVE